MKPKSDARPYGAGPPTPRLPATPPDPPGGGRYTITPGSGQGGFLNPDGSRNPNYERRIKPGLK